MAMRIRSPSASTSRTSWLESTPGTRRRPSAKWQSYGRSRSSSRLPPGLQCFIALGMTMLIVDLFEQVDIQPEQADMALFASAAADFGFDAFGHAASIQQLGERIGVGQPIQRLGAFATLLSSSCRAFLLRRAPCAENARSDGRFHPGCAARQARQFALRHVLHRQIELLQRPQDLSTEHQIEQHQRHQQGQP
jgi:hypothetical protein